MSPEHGLQMHMMVMSHMTYFSGPLVNVVCSYFVVWAQPVLPSRMRCRSSCGRSHCLRSKELQVHTALHTSRSAHTAANANTHVDMAILSCSQMDRPTVQKNINQDTNILHCNLSELFYYLTFCNHLSFCSCVRCFALLRCTLQFQSNTKSLPTEAN